MAEKTAELTLALKDENATRALAASLARLLRAGDMVALSGELGAGKTALARAVIQTLAGDDEEVPSPTFTLVQAYDTPAATIWHFDLYRLASPEEIFELGWEEARASGICLIEWPDRLGGLLPDDRPDLALSYGLSEDARIARLTGHGLWHERIAALR